MCSSTMREREVFWGDWGIRDGNDLIEEQVKMEMSDGMFQNNQKSSFHLVSFSFLFFSFPLCSSPPHPPSTQNLLYLSHDVHPDDYGSDCVDDDCC